MLFVFSHNALHHVIAKLRILSGWRDKDAPLPEGVAAAPMQTKQAPRTIMARIAALQQQQILHILIQPEYQHTTVVTISRPRILQKPKEL